MKNFARKYSSRPAALLLALLVFALSVFCACGRGGETGDADAKTESPAEATPASTEPATDAPAGTPVPEGPFELFDYVGEPGENTAGRIEELASKIQGLSVSRSQQFGDAYFLGAGIELGLNLSADEFDPVFLCFVDGNDMLTVGGIRVGMELDELKTVCPDLLVNLNLRSAYYDYSDTAGLELTFDSEYRVKTITYSITGESSDS